MNKNISITLQEPKEKLNLGNVEFLTMYLEMKQISVVEEVIFICVFPELSAYTNISDKLVLE